MTLSATRTKTVLECSMFARKMFLMSKYLPSQSRPVRSLSSRFLFPLFVVNCCRRILVIFSYYNVWSMLVASPICACIIAINSYIVVAFCSPLSFFVYSCRGILLIPFYCNVRSMFVASPICACTILPFEFNASAVFSNY